MCHQLLPKYLNQIPENDPHSLTLPVDPLDSLPEKLKLKELSPYDVKWSVERNVLEYIKDCAVASSVKKKTKSQRVWDEEYKRDENSERRSQLGQKSLKLTDDTLQLIIFIRCIDPCRQY